MRVSVYVPTRDESGNKISYKDTLRNTACFMCAQFGGCTTTTARGNWLNEEHVFTQERVFVVEAYTNDKGAPFLVKHAATLIKSTLNQEAVAYTIDNEMFFI